MNANQARFLTKKNVGQLPRIYKEIEKAAKSGKQKCYYYKGLSADEKKELISQGYSVTDNFTRNEILITIDWSSASEDNLIDEPLKQ